MLTGVEPPNRATYHDMRGGKGLGDRVEVEPHVALRLARGLGETSGDLRAILGKLNAANREIGRAAARVDDARRLIAQTAAEPDRLDGEVARRALLLVAAEGRADPLQVYWPGVGIGLLR